MRSIRFTAMHEIAARTSYEKGVCPSVCQTRALWQNRRKSCPDFYTLQKIS